MNKPLGKEDREYLRTIARNKGWDLGYYLLAWNVRGEPFDYIMAGSDTVKYESPKQRQEWLAGAMRRMEETLPAAFIKQIRESSACCLSGQRDTLAKQIHDQCATVAERFERLAKERYIIGDTARKIDENTYQICFWEHPPEGGSCSCLKYVPKKEPMPKSWCLCCGGHIKHHFETALGVKAECRCLSSQLSSCGKEPCRFELTITQVL